MVPKDKAKELVDTYRIMLMNSDTECGEEILCTVIAKYCAVIAVDEIVKYFESYVILDYWNKVKKEIEKL